MKKSMNQHYLSTTVMSSVVVAAGFMVALRLIPIEQLIESIKYLKTHNFTFGLILSIYGGSYILAYYYFVISRMSMIGMLNVMRDACIDNNVDIEAYVEKKMKRAMHRDDSDGIFKV